MDWVPIKVQDLRTPQFLSASQADRGTWLSLLAYCAGAENGGRIKGMGEWTPQTVERVIGIGLADVETESALWSWDGVDLVVLNYPHDAERRVEASRVAGKRGAAARWGKEDSEPTTKFVKPTVGELTEAFKSKGYTATKASEKAIDFINHYETWGWKVNGKTMKSWPHAVGTWVRREPPTQKLQKGGIAD